MTSARVSTSGWSPGHRGRGPSCWPPTPRCSSRFPTTSPTRRRCWPTPSRSPSTPSSAIPRPRRARCWSSEPAPWGWPAWPSSPSLYPGRRGGGGGPVPGAGRAWPGPSAPRWSSPTSPAWPWSRPWPSGRAASCTGLRRPAHGPPRPHRRGLRLGGQARDLRGRRAGAGRAGRLVYTGVAVPGRWEWTPVYFKELTIVGSNAFAIEEFEGVRKHAIDHYLALVQAGRIDLTAMVTHRYPPRGLVGRAQGPGPPGRQRRAQGRLHPQPGLTRPADRTPDAAGSGARAQGLELLEALRGGGGPGRVGLDPPPRLGPTGRRRRTTRSRARPPSGPGRRPPGRRPRTPPPCPPAGRWHRPPPASRGASGTHRRWPRSGGPAWPSVDHPPDHESTGLVGAPEQGLGSLGDVEAVHTGPQLGIVERGALAPQIGQPDRHPGGIAGPLVTGTGPSPAAGGRRPRRAPDHGARPSRRRGPRRCWVRRSGTGRARCGAG